MCTCARPSRFRALAKGSASAGDASRAGRVPRVSKTFAAAQKLKPLRARPARLTMGAAMAPRAAWSGHPSAALLKPSRPHPNLHVNVCAPFAFPCACQGVRISGRRVARGARAARFQNFRGRQKNETAPRMTRAPYHGCRHGATSRLVWAPVGGSAKTVAAASEFACARVRARRVSVRLPRGPHQRATRRARGACRAFPKLARPPQK